MSTVAPILQAGNWQRSSYYRARYYDPQMGRFLSEDPVGFRGGSNFYLYALARPTVLIDQLGLDGHTWGPITFYTNQEGMSAAQVNAERAHEQQHRCDFWNGNVFTQPCEFLESRGFAAEVPILQQRISDLDAQKTLSSAEKNEKQQLMEELSRAQGFADSHGIPIHYYCHPQGVSVGFPQNPSHTPLGHNPWSPFDPWPLPKP